MRTDPVHQQGCWPGRSFCSTTGSSKLVMTVRFPSPAPTENPQVRCAAWPFTWQGREAFLAPRARCVPRTCHCNCCPMPRRAARHVSRLTCPSDRLRRLCTRRLLARIGADGETGQNSQRDGTTVKLCWCKESDSLRAFQVGSMTRRCSPSSRWLPATSARGSC